MNWSAKAAFAKINFAPTPLEYVGKELAKAMNNVIIVQTNVFVLLEIAGIFNSKS